MRVRSRWVVPVLEEDIVALLVCCSYFMLALVVAVAALGMCEALSVVSALRWQFCAFPVSAVCCDCALVCGKQLLRIAPKEVNCSRI